MNIALKKIKSARYQIKLAQKVLDFKKKPFIQDDLPVINTLNYEQQKKNRADQIKIDNERVLRQNPNIEFPSQEDADKLAALYDFVKKCSNNLESELKEGEFTGEDLIYVPKRLTKLWNLAQYIFKAKNSIKETRSILAREEDIRHAVHSGPLHDLERLSAPPIKLAESAIERLKKLPLSKEIPNLRDKSTTSPKKIIRPLSTPTDPFLLPDKPQSGWSLTKKQYDEFKNSLEQLHGKRGTLISDEQTSEVFFIPNASFEKILATLSYQGIEDESIEEVDPNYLLEHAPYFNSSIFHSTSDMPPPIHYNENSSQFSIKTMTLSEWIDNYKRTYKSNTRYRSRPTDEE